MHCVDGGLGFRFAFLRNGCNQSVAGIEPTPSLNSRMAKLLPPGRVRAAEAGAGTLPKLAHSVPRWAAEGGQPSPPRNRPAGAQPGPEAVHPHSPRSRPGPLPRRDFRRCQCGCFRRSPDDDRGAVGGVLQCLRRQMAVAHGHLGITVTKYLLHLV